MLNCIFFIDSFIEEFSIEEFSVVKLYNRKTPINSQYDIWWIMHLNALMIVARALDYVNRFRPWKWFTVSRLKKSFCHLPQLDPSPEYDRILPAGEYLLLQGVLP